VIAWLLTTALAQGPEATSQSPLDPCTTDDVAGCERQCLDGSPKSCSTAGYYLEVGLGVSRDPQRAAELYRLGCSGGDGRGCGNLGVLYDLGRGVDVDVAQALVMYRRGCRVADGASCLNLGIHMATGDGVGQDAPQATKHYALACEHGEPRGCNLLGAEQEASDPSAAVALYSQACEGGDGPGCYNLARMVNAGHARLPQADVVKLYETACDVGETAACLDLGVHLLNGTGIAQDQARAARYFQDACEADLPKGCSLRGAVYLNEDQDGPGFALLELGCSRGDAWGCRVLAQVREDEGGD
jgi:uncharacterized protein